MKKLGRKGNFESGSLTAFACVCRCNCLCLTCNNCTSVAMATGREVMAYVNDSNNYTQSFGMMTLLG